MMFGDLIPPILTLLEPTLDLGAETIPDPGKECFTSLDGPEAGTIGSYFYDATMGVNSSSSSLIARISGLLLS